VGLAFGAFFMQLMVQGAWGVVPAHLNELAPAGIRATFPGVVYQLGNLIASRNAVIQQSLVDAQGSPMRPDYSFGLAVVAGGAALLLVVLSLLGLEKRDVNFASQPPDTRLNDHAGRRRNLPGCRRVNPAGKTCCGAAYLKQVRLH
jgi:SHS family lactate transporter-like MFS transporter